MKKKATRKRVAKKKPAATKRKRSPRRDPRALTEQQIRRELKATDEIKWAWCLQNGMPINDDQTFDLVSVAAWILKGSAKRHGGRG